MRSVFSSRIWLGLIIIFVGIAGALFAHATAFAHHAEGPDALTSRHGCDSGESGTHPHDGLYGFIWIKPNASIAIGLVFNASHYRCRDIGMASYAVDAADGTLTLFDSKTAVIGPRQVRVLKVKLPCHGQVNLFAGPVITTPPIDYGERSLRVRHFDLWTPKCRPTPTPTASATPSPTSTNTATPTDTATPTNTSTPTDTATPTPTNTATPTITPTSTNTATPTDTATPTPTDTFTPTPTESVTPTPEALTAKDAEVFRDASPTPVPGVVQPGDRVAYSVWFTNTGTVDVLQASIRDAIPGDTTYVPGSASSNGGLTIGNPLVAVMDRLPPGQVFTLTFTVIVNQQPEGLEIINQAIIEAANIDPPDPTVVLLVDANRNGIPDIIESTPRYFFYLPVILQSSGD